MSDRCAAAAASRSPRRGLRTNVQYRIGLCLPQGDDMESSIRRRSRRSLRPAVRDELTEGAIVMTEPEGMSTLEISGGPPRARVEVNVDGVELRAFRLDACGCAVLCLAGIHPGAGIEISVDGRVLLAGHLPPPMRQVHA